MGNEAPSSCTGEGLHLPSENVVFELKDLYGGRVLREVRQYAMAARAKTVKAHRSTSDFSIGECQQLFIPGILYTSFV